MKTKFLDNILNLGVKEGSKILLGISGGKDSVCMLDLFNSIKDFLKFELIVLHYNHSLRDASDSDEKFVIDLAKKYNLKFYTKKEDVTSYSNKEKISIEEAARKLRYKFFEEIMSLEKADYIATAHNKNDNVETLLMRIFRGTGINGLVGIPKKNNHIIRPMLIFDVDSINSYISENELKIVEDHTNSLNIYNRNKIRNDLIPKLERDYNINLLDAIDRLSEISGYYVDTVKDLVKSKEGILYFFEDNKIRVNIEKLKLEKESFRYIFYREIFEYINKISEGISFERIDKIDGLLNSSTGKYLIVKDIVFEVNYEFLDIYKREEKKEDYSKFYFENLDFSLYSTGFFDIIIEQSNVENFIKNRECRDFLFINEDYLKKLKIRPRKNGDYINLSFGRKKIKDIFIDNKVDKTLRDLIPIFEINKDIVWVSTIKRSNKYLVNTKEKIICIKVIRRSNETSR